MQRVFLVAGLLAVATALPFDGNRIVNGQNATIKEFPYQGSLRYNGNHFCGCSLIGPRVVLTAAHCTNGADVKYLSVHFGSTFHADTKGQIIKVAEVRQHEKYIPPSMDTDVSILILERGVVYTDKVKRVKIAHQAPKTGDWAIASGWGVLKQNSQDPSPQLQKLVAPVVDRDPCNSAYGGKISYRMICAGYMEGGKDVCQGDSGGPLVNANQEQIGIVSWGYGCARPFYPGVYTNVAEVADWIDEHSKI